MFIKKKKKKESQIIIQVSALQQFPQVTLLGKAKATVAESSPKASVCPKPPPPWPCREDL